MLMAKQIAMADVDDLEAESKRVNMVLGLLDKVEDIRNWTETHVKPSESDSTAMVVQVSDNLPSLSQPAPQNAPDSPSGPPPEPVDNPAPTEPVKYFCIKSHYTTCEGKRRRIHEGDIAEGPANAMDGMLLKTGSGLISMVEGCWEYA